MTGVSKIVLIGNLGRAAETRYTPNGTLTASFTVAVNHRPRPARPDDSPVAGHAEHEPTGMPGPPTWYRVAAWGRLAESLDGLAAVGGLAKGRLVYVEGRLGPREYQDRHGQVRTSLDVTATDVQVLGARPDGPVSPEPPPLPGALGLTGAPDDAVGVGQAGHGPDRRAPATRAWTGRGVRAA